MGKESIRIIFISDLLHLSSPLTGTSSLHSQSSPSPPPLKKLKTLANPNPDPRFFSPFNEPVLLIGTVGLPSPQDSCKGHCLSFSDGSSRVCCSILDLQDLSFIGNKIHVLAWNFLPFKHKKDGVLEIVRWTSPPSSQISPKIQPPLSLPLRSHNLTAVGALKSVSPIFSVPCRNPGSGGDSIGFLVEIITCSCKLCSNYDLKNPLSELSRHSFSNSNFVYFLKPASKWRPVLNMLVGKLVLISGLKKKLIFVGEQASYEMFLATEMTMVSLCQLPLGGVSIWKDEGVYNGVVTGVYMQGMAVELDKKVWLVVTNPKIAPPHSVRVGAIISVRNFHLVCPKFSWIQMHLLGTCARTSIVVKSFSFADTRSYVRTESQSMLGRFIDSLKVSAKFWLLLLVSCFRKKFAKVFSDKEILGSENSVGNVNFFESLTLAFSRCQHEGLAQVYASGYLDSHFFQSQHGIFKEFCKHGQCTSDNESNMSSLKLVTPISNLISKCEALWASIISKTQCDAETVKKNNCGKHFTSKVASCSCTIRRIVSSEDLGFLLMGTLKVSSLGRLQLVDATGSIDVVIPDLVSNINCQNIYEVKNYKLIMEGTPLQLGCMGFHSIEAFSCRNIFEQFFLKKVLNQLRIYVLFYLRDAACLNVPFRLPSCKFENDIFSITGETTHLLLVTHKFPATENFQSDPIQGDQLISCNSILYAEAVVLPYKLLLLKDNDCNLLANSLLGELHEESNFVERDGWFKRPRSFRVPSRNIVDVSKNDSEQVQRKVYKIPCLFTFKGTDGQGSPVPGYLCPTENTALGKQQENRILLEFKSDSFFKYQLLQLGGYYILKHSHRGQCKTAVSNKTNHDKILITPQMTLWSLSFSFGEIMHQTDPLQDHSSEVSSFGVCEAYVGNASQSKVILQQSVSQMHKNPDVHVHLCSEVKDVFRTFPEFREVLSVSSCIQIMEVEVGITSSSADPQCRDMPQGNLISLCGNIEKIQTSYWKPRPYMSSKHLDCLGTDQRTGFDIVIHVYDEHHKVQIHGNMSKHVYPVGMARGANATFHRVLMTCSSIGCPRLVLTPVSFIVINSVKEDGHQHSKKRIVPQKKFNVSVEESSGIVLGLISQLTQSREIKLVRFSCRVLNVYILVLELPSSAPSKFRSKQPLKLPAFNITLAGLMLDDGSSISYCWANAGTAERLLKLHETTQRPFFRSRRSSTKTEMKSSRDTVGYHLEKMLKKHHRVIVKNNRVAPDSSALGFTFIVDSQEVFSCSDERLLRLVMLNACVGSAFNIIGTLMDSNALRSLDAELKELHVATQPVQNVWITEVGCLNPLDEARNILHDLGS